MTLAPAVRRITVTIGLAFAILAAAGTMAAAARWVATEAPLDAAPVSIQSVQRALEQERQRSGALEAQLKALEAASGDLSAALTTAQQQLAADAGTADDLRTALTSAQAKLRKLEAALAAAATTRTTRSGSSGGATVQPAVEREVEHDDD